VPLLPFTAITDLLFANVQKDNLQGLKIWTDQSLLNASGTGPSQESFIRIQVVPQNIQFTQRSRISEQVIKDGRAFFFWRKDRKSSHLDLLEIQISGITRSLAQEPKRLGGLAALQQIGRGIASEVPLIGNLVGHTPSPPPEKEPTPKQKEWLRLWRVTREPFVVENGINEHHILLETPALPWAGGIQFVGHFTAPIQFSEVAENPFLVSWQLGLIVHYTIPSFDTLFKMMDHSTARVGVGTAANPGGGPSEPTPPTDVPGPGSPSPAWEEHSSFIPDPNAPFLKGDLS
jgi:hypothetical protein